MLKPKRGDVKSTWWSKLGNQIAMHFLGLLAGYHSFVSSQARRKVSVSPTNVLPTAKHDDVFLALYCIVAWCHSRLCCRVEWSVIVEERNSKVVGRIRHCVMSPTPSSARPTSYRLSTHHVGNLEFSFTRPRFPFSVPTPPFAEFRWYLRRPPTRVR